LFSSIFEANRLFLSVAYMGGALNEYEVDVVVIGAGVVGLACARELSLAGREVFVLEAHDHFGAVSSSRNSEVIHSGVYYESGSLKHSLCARGNELLYRYCESKGIQNRKCGKLIVATSGPEVAYLESLYEKAKSKGLDDMRLVTSMEISAMQPEVKAEAAIFSPSTGIIDSHGLMLALLADAQLRGAQLVCNSPVVSWSLSKAARIRLEIGGAQTTIVHASAVVNSAGLSAPALAKALSGFPARHIPHTAFCKGNYFSLSGKSPFSMLVYPVPDAAGLGVHLTIDLAGQARFGPDVEWLRTENVADLDYRVDANRKDSFYERIEKYWPAVKQRSLTPGYSGVRPKIFASDGSAINDFVVSTPVDHGVSGLIHLFGIESPGLTASMAIAEYVSMALQRDDLAPESRTPV
jgi:L-2-hydroxyglutarate oxidase LhgO